MAGKILSLCKFKAGEGSLCECKYRVKTTSEIHTGEVDTCQLGTSQPPCVHMKRKRVVITLEDVE